MTEESTIPLETLIQHSVMDSIDIVFLIVSFCLARRFGKMKSGVFSSKVSLGFYLLFFASLVPFLYNLIGIPVSVLFQIELTASLDFYLSNAPYYILQSLSFVFFLQASKSYLSEPAQV